MRNNDRVSESREQRVSEFRTQRRIEFADTDLSGLVHFSRYFVFMETTEHLFLESLGTSVHVTEGSDEIGWPRVQATCEYLSAVRFGDEIDIRLAVLRKGGKSLTYGFWFTHQGRPVARGKVTAVCCVVNDPRGLRPLPIPAAIADRIEEATPEPVEEQRGA
jgi:YbgC/YbaW family acyl-CoA thioester hydrolase